MLAHIQIKLSKLLFTPPFQILSKQGYAYLQAKVLNEISLLFTHDTSNFSNKQTRANKLRAHGKPWMQRVPYTLPLYKLPPELSFLLKGFSCSFSISI